MIFLEHNLPSPTTVLWGIPVALIWSFLCLFFAGFLKTKRMQTGNTRKIFHFLIFMTVSVIHVSWGTGGVFIFGFATSLVIFYALLKGDGHPMYEALARDADRPRRTHYILAPYFATLIGGLISALLFGETAIVGYLVTGLGDAVGEPVGTRFGKHTYPVSAFRGVRAVRTYEGSAAVFVVSLAAIVVGIAASPQLILSGSQWLLLAVLGFICTVLEAISPHGWDNATLQIIPTYLAKAWF